MARNVILDSEGNDITEEFFKGADSTSREMDDPDMEDPKMSCRETILEEAKMCICHDRQNQYGSPEDSFAAIANYWSIYLLNSKKIVEPITSKDVALMMVLLKIARTEGHAHHADNYVDMAGYAALAAELAQNELEIK